MVSVPPFHVTTRDDDTRTVTREQTRQTPLRSTSAHPEGPPQGRRPRPRHNNAASVVPTTGRVSTVCTPCQDHGSRTHTVSWKAPLRGCTSSGETIYITGKTTAAGFIANALEDLARQNTAPAHVVRAASCRALACEAPAGRLGRARPVASPTLCTCGFRRRTAGRTTAIASDRCSPGVGGQGQLSSGGRCASVPRGWGSGQGRHPDSRVLCPRWCMATCCNALPAQCTARAEAGGEGPGPDLTPHSVASTASRRISELRWVKGASLAGR